MTLCPDALLDLLVRGMQGALSATFTGKVTITINFHKGTAAHAAVGIEEGKKLDG